jgi:hypothetical protein
MFKEHKSNTGWWRSHFTLEAKRKRQAKSDFCATRYNRISATLRFFVFDIYMKYARLDKEES